MSNSSKVLQEQSKITKGSSQLGIADIGVNQNFILGQAHSAS